MADDGLTPDNVSQRFAHHPPTSHAVVGAHENARLQCEALALWVLSLLPPGDHRQRAVDAIDQACMAINAAIARTQLLPALAWSDGEPQG